MRLNNCWLTYLQPLYYFITLFLSLYLWTICSIEHRFSHTLEWRIYSDTVDYVGCVTICHNESCLRQSSKCNPSININVFEALYIYIYVCVSKIFDQMPTFGNIIVNMQAGVMLAIILINDWLNIIIYLSSSIYLSRS